MPKKQSSFFFITTIFFIFLSGLFISCKSELTDQAPVSFSLPQKMFRMAGDFFETEDGEEDYNFTLMVKLVDSSLKDVVDPYEETKKISEWEEAFDINENSYTVTFDKVPVGIEVYALISLYTNIDNKKVEFFNGNSESLLVEEGSNSLSVKLANVIPKVKVNFVFQETFGSTTYNENEKFPALILNFFGDTDIEHMAALTKTIMAAYMAGYQVNEEKMPETPEIQKDGSFAMTIYFDLIGETIPGSGSISYNLDYSPLTISIDKEEINMAGDTITITVKDKDGNVIAPEDLEYGISLFYKGKEVSNSDFLERDSSRIKINALDSFGDYSMYVVVLYMKDGILPVIGNQNFNLSTVVNNIPELYVSASGSLDNDGSTIEKALPSIAAAQYRIAKYSRYEDREFDLTINVVGTLNEPQTLNVNHAKSIIIQGSSNAEINANADSLHPASAFEITSTCPVIIKNIKFTGGYAESGGGIKIARNSNLTIENVMITGNYATYEGGGLYNESGTVVMKDGTITGNIAEYCGGGIYSKGSVYIYGSAVIGDKENNTSASYDTANPDSTSYGNLCLNSNDKEDSGGGGIYCRELYLGYSGMDDDYNLVPAELTGGIYRNYAANKGGAIYLISYGQVKMNSGLIINNNSSDDGKAIWLPAYGGSFIISGSSEIDSSNDIYLSYGNSESFAYITVAGVLEKEHVATITPGSTQNYRVLKLADDINPDEFGYTFVNKFIASDGRYIIGDGILSNEPGA